MKSKLNIVFMGQFTYPHGMAGTKRNQHAITSLKKYDNTRIQVVVLRQSSKNNPISGVYEDIHYQTIGPNYERLKLLLLFPIYLLKGIRILNKAFCKDSKNILHVYNSPAFDNIPFVLYAKMRGFKIIFDIIEDYSFSKNLKNLLRHRICTFITLILQSKIKKYTDGIIVISSHLENKFKTIFDPTSQILFRPISVNLKYYENKIFKFNTNKISLFYAGSYGKKDSVENLIEAFNILSEEFNNLALILAGKTYEESFKIIRTKINNSDYKNNINYMGYLDDEFYYKTLNSCDIPCMTRTDIAYANAGFPFKLGEYLSTGKPVIASDVSDVRKYLTNKKNAMILKPGSIESIVSSIRYLISHPEQAAEIGYNGRKVAEEHFDYNAHGEKLYNFFNTI